MTDITITFAGEANQGGYGDLYAFKPCLWARQGDVDILRAWVELDGMIGDITEHQLQALGYADSRELLQKAMLRYGIRRLEPLVREMLSSGVRSGVVSPTWKLDREERPALLALATSKTCDYQAKIRRDLFCTIPAANDATAVQIIDGRGAAPTSRPICYGCELPDTDIICSHLLHPATMGFDPPYSRRVAQAICDLDRPEVADVSNCRIGGHECSQRLVALDPPITSPQLSALGLPEALDVLDAHWRLAFGKSRRLLTLSTVTGPSSLALDCSSRAEFDSRMSSLAATIERLKVDEDLLPDELRGDTKVVGSLTRLEACLIDKLPAGQHQSVRSAIQVLRRVQQARSGAQHAVAAGGLTESLASLGITDAPPNWTGAWDTIRAKSTDALTVIRHELRQWIDDQGG